MTDDQIHKEVLKVMGWKLETKKLRNGTGYQYSINGQGASVGGGFYGWGWQGTEKSAALHLPPLTLDLMWQAEEMLSPREREEYCVILISEDDLNCSSRWDCAHATATQRARAFLKAKSTPSP